MIAQVETAVKKLHLGCGKDIKADWTNIDLLPGIGVDIVADLDQCRTTPLPFEDNSFDEFLGSPLLEHLHDPLSLMQELHRIAKPDALATFRVPYGGSDEAYEDPTHVRQYFVNSWGYFSQPFYWKADYGYRGDWIINKLYLLVSRQRYEGQNPQQIFNEIMMFRNVAIEMVAELIAVKPIREAKSELQTQPNIEIQLI